MPTECIANPLQRELADSIIRMVPLDEIRILLACGAKVNEAVTQGLMPLHYAVWQRYYEAAQLLLTRGGDVNATDECGYSPLHLSAEHGYTEVVRLLLMSGAKVDYRPNTGEDFPRTTQCDEPLRLAIRNKHMTIARMLLEHGADPNKRYFFGAEINLVTDLEFLELLLNFGANPDSRDRSGLTPLMKAVRQPQGMEAVLLLLKHGADVNAMTDERHDYRTVLHYAVLSGNHEIINLILKQGAKLNYDEAFDLGKPSPLDLAILKGDPKIVELLISSEQYVEFVTERPGITKEGDFLCYDCTGGPLTPCSLIVPTGMDIVCSGKNSHCYEAYIEYQNGALPLVERRCWQKPNNTEANSFCEWFNNPRGKLLFCNSCRGHYCNGHPFNLRATRNNYFPNQRSA